jgi:N-acetylglucosaminyldiphosphoundecaprenol N-acetyl-beta-D-mannosaminyltransferase
VRLFGLDFDPLTQATLLDRIAECVRERSSCWIETVNVSHLCLAARDPALDRLFRSADVILADGMPIVWMSRLRGRALRARVTGSDLMEPLARRAAAEGWRIFLCGGEEGVAAREAARLCEAAPGLQIAGTAAPHFPTSASLTDAARNRALLAQLRAARADIVLVAFGAPKQELWIRHHLASGALPVPVAIGVGGSLDFVAGQQRRAPPWMRRSGLEWVHRMTTQPRRLGPRYAGDLLTFAQLAARELLRDDPRDVATGSAP